MADSSGYRRNADARAAIFGYRLRFSPDTHSIRQAVIDHLVLKGLHDAGTPSGASVGHLTAITVGDATVGNISIDEVKASLARLENASLASRAVVKGKTRWGIGEEGQRRLEKEEADTLELLDKTIQLLFGDEASAEIRACFVHCLSHVFDHLAKSYVETIASGAGTDVLTDSLLEPFVVDAVNAHPPVPRDQFAMGVRRFFRDQNPAFDSLKWMFCQNYYFVRAMGLGKESDLLSKHLFEGGTFFLDTNVLIVALDASSPHHSSLQQVLESLRAINCAIRVLRPTLAELARVADWQDGQLEKTLAQIPDALLPRVSGFIARAEARYRQDPSQPPPREVLGQFKDPVGRLEALSIDVIDDPWFAEHENDEAVRDLAERLRVHYNATTTARTKSASAAAHDALSLLWIDQRARANELFLTLDASLPSLPSAPSDFGRGRSPAISSYAVLPWLGSVVMGGSEEAASAYSALLAAQLLTMGTRFNIQEFRLLAELELECRELPADDVEQCLLHLRREARSLHVSKAEDREKLHHIVRSFFASPERKYPDELARLQRELEEARSSLKEREERATRELERVEREASEKLKNLDDERVREVSATQETADKQRRGWLRARVRLRLTIIGVCYLAALLACLQVAHVFGAGENLAQKISDVWWLFGTVTAILPFAIRWWCRGELWPHARELLGSLGDDESELGGG